ncbi:MAG: anti-sigma factor antagonist [Salinivirgaceae bacterium]|nr:anti-sigma factor antagonist [Salinivirgaceae bacterium]
MDFTVVSEITDNIATVTLKGSLDSASASVFQEEIQKLIGQPIKDLVLRVSELSFMASAGLRMIIFAKQKLGSAVNIFLVSPQDQIIDTLQMTGFIHSVHIVDKYPK